MGSFPDISGTKIVVIGDVMLDRFWGGSCRRISPEAPVPIVDIQTKEDRAGGAGNVAVNLANLGASVSLVGIAGNDQYGRELKKCVESAGVCWEVMQCEAETIIKFRVLSRNQQLIRMDFEQDLSKYADKFFLKHAQQQIESADLVIFSDYGKGSLSSINLLLQYCRRVDKTTLIDPKGDCFEKYRGGMLLTPNLAEFEKVVGPCPNSEVLVTKAEKLRASLDLEAILVTRSEAGMTLIEAARAPEHFEASAREVFDVTGAGDTVIAVIAACLGSGLTLSESAQFANTAAGLVVAKLGTASVTPEELMAAKSLITSAPLVEKILSESDLVDRLISLRGQGLRIVMTNGCFDLIHPGHVSYLREAANLGDILIVAVNDDESVRKLKGDSRPINTVRDRMAVLEGIEAVDLITSFQEDNPERLISVLKPDFLVKGGDYTIDQIAGSESVIENGGQVVILSYLKNYSTSNLIGRLTD